jgi:hypothetical protein
MNDEFNSNFNSNSNNINIDYSSKIDNQINKKKIINNRHKSNFSITGDFKKK